MDLDTIHTLDELEELAHARVDRVVRDYWALGAGANVTVRENATAFTRYRLRPRVLVDVRRVDLATRVLGHRVELPFGIASSGWHKLAHPAGEAATAAAARACGTLMGVSMGTAMATKPRAAANPPPAAAAAAASSPEEIRAAGGDAAAFFQLYLFANRAAMARVLRRVEQAGYAALMLTVDTPYVGRRLADLRNQAQLPPFLKAISDGDDDDSSASSSYTLDPSLTWDTALPWLRAHTRLPIWLKGIVTAEDAALAVAHGVDGLVVSNHGGRQLDLCVPTLDALPEVVAAVREAAATAGAAPLPIHLDGGVRRGEDVFRALALGAAFVWIGRPALWGLACGGQAGVERMLAILRDELRLCMALTGCAALDDITPARLWLAGEGARL